eukprot:TRINITY_DN30991_c0_g1_i1.p1 TRINITY_DN30991_c0_g1~~TRINITY_DN30991_c0_g1_i1.p1  ORF type:complete len:395 (+),score=117.33 TRINITY_DN30991_c0_g1_i1:89-1273(+)
MCGSVENIKAAEPDTAKTADGLLSAASLGISWKQPGEVEGLKSRKKAIFEVNTSNLLVGDMISRVVSARLTLESRVVAVGDAGMAVVEVALGQREVEKGGQVSLHSDLNIVVLGPTSGGLTEDATVEELCSAINLQLEAKPQVVILQAPPCGGGRGKAWASIFHVLLGCQEMLSYRGAVVVCAAEETAAMKSVCSERWTGRSGWIWKEAVGVDKLELLDDVLEEDLSANPNLSELLREASGLAKKRFEGEDSIEKARERGWTLSLLVSTDQDGKKSLRSFACYTFHGKELHIARIAAEYGHRGAGLGTYFMTWLLTKAAEMPQSKCAWICCSSLVSAVPFYEKYGFCDMTCDDVDDDDHFQTWMELKNNSVVDDDPDTESEASSDDDEESEDDA